MVDSFIIKLNADPRGPYWYKGIYSIEYTLYSNISK